jgi:alanyl-tRNA synthetase
MNDDGPGPTRLLHQEDTRLLGFEATVLAVRLSAEGWEVALDRTAFYAESGGQPSDHGLLAGRPVLALRREKGVVWHTVAESELAPGDPVVGRVDGERRRDHVQQHTGQHILSQAFVREGGRNTRSFHLGAEESTIDLDGEKPDAALLEAVVSAANACVLEDRPIHIHEVPRDELDRFPLRRDPGAEHEILRLVEIEDWDWSACGGTHAGRTGEVGTVHVLGVEKIRELWRVRFLAGGRTVRYLYRAHRVLDETARAHSLRWDAIAEATRGWTAEIAALAREVRRLRVERGEREADRLRLETAPQPGEARLFGLWLEHAGPDELRALASRLAVAGKVLVLAGCPDGDRETWVAARGPDWPAGEGWRPHAGECLRDWLASRGGKGGGSDAFAQGGAPRNVSADPGEAARAFLQNRMPKGLPAAE